MKQLNNEDRADIAERTAEDLAFQKKLEGYDNITLSMGLTQMIGNPVTREWMLNYLEETEAVLDLMKVDRPSLQDSIFDAIRTQRATQDAEFGPIQMNPRTMPEWTDRLSRLVTKAYSKAGSGEDLAALRLVLDIATEAVAAMEDRIEAEAAKGAPLLSERMKMLFDNGQSKKADDAGTSPADKSDSSN